MILVTKMAASAEKRFKQKHRRRKQQSPAHALKASLRQAAAQKRLTVGLNNCVLQLKRSPESVMVCVLLHGAAAAASSQQAADQATSNIQHTLLQAFCTENRISLLQLLPDVAVMRLVQQLAGKVRKERGSEVSVQTDPGDCSLLLIQYPEGMLSCEDKLWLGASVGGQLNIGTSPLPPSD